jgi:hypothetical protein
MTQIMSPGCGHGTWIVIPAYNEERVMAGVIGEAVRSGHRVVVVDDGSSDATAEIGARAGDVKEASDKSWTGRCTSDRHHIAPAQERIL